MYLCDSFKSDGTNERIANINIICSNRKAFFFCEATSQMFLIYNQNYDET